MAHAATVQNADRFFIGNTKQSPNQFICCNCDLVHDVDSIIPQIEILNLKYACVADSPFHSFTLSLFHIELTRPILANKSVNL